MDKMQSNANASIGRGNVGGGGRGRPVQKPHDLRGTMKMLWQALSGLRGQLALVCGIALVISAASVVIPLISGAAVDACGTGPGEVNSPCCAIPC